MNDALPSGLREASRLTRAGRLTEATALLQRVLHRGKDPYSAPASENVPCIIDLVPDTVEVTGPEPSLRTRQQFAARDRGGETQARAYLPKGLRCFFDQITPTGLGRGLNGLAEPFSADTPGASEGGKFLAKSYNSEAGSRVYKKTPTILWWALVRLERNVRNYFFLPPVISQVPQHTEQRSRLRAEQQGQQGPQFHVFSLEGEVGQPLRRPGAGRWPASGCFGAVGRAARRRRRCAGPACDSSPGTATSSAPRRWRT